MGIVYCARDTITGKLVSDITNPRRKYWDRFNNCKTAVDRHNRYIEKGYSCQHNKLEVVRFELKEIK